MTLERHPFDSAADIADRVNRLAKVAPRITYVILCWQGEGWAKDIEYFDVRAAADAILGPFTEWEARRVAGLLTCECEVTNITTEPPRWATAPQPQPPTA